LNLISQYQAETMNPTAAPQDIDELLAILRTAESLGEISDSAIKNLEDWLTENRYRPYVEQIAQHIREKRFKQLDDVFWTVIPFGTGGRRGRMYPFGSNAINEQTIGESAQGLANYVKLTKPAGPWSAAIAYDTRHRSREFAELCADILVANGFTIYFIDDYRSTPELSFLVRWKKCDCGIMVTASHNPPSDNAVKVYWSNGAQLIPPHDKAVIAEVGQVREILRSDFAAGVSAGKIMFCREETDAALLQEHLRQSFGGPRNLKVIYSPLHGVGEFNVGTLLQAAGFPEVEIYERHREPSGDFPNVPGNVSNPENSAVFDEIIERAKQTGAELILASDPDCDRMGAAAPVSLDPSGDWKTFNGNQLSALLGEFVLSQRQAKGQLKPGSYVVTTLVTTPLLEKIAKRYGVRFLGNNLVGFKWICNVMDEVGAEDFVYGTEESHGFLVGQYCRDKDGAIACLLMSELAAVVKASGKSLHQYLDELYGIYGVHLERLVNIQMEGSDGMRRMQRLMERFRSAPPGKLGGLRVAGMRDYLHGRQREAGGADRPLNGPQDNLIFLETDVPGNYIAARPSGTEPKVKFYLFTFAPPASGTELVQSRSELNRRLDGFVADLKEFAASVD
jgi:phosphoglucomutase/phosphomannomutase